MLRTACPTYSATTATAMYSPPSSTSRAMTTDVQPGTGIVPRIRSTISHAPTTSPVRAITTPAAAMNRSGRVPLDTIIRQKWLSSRR